MNKNFSKLFLVLFLLNLFFYYNYINLDVENRVVMSPDENALLFFSKQIIEESSIVWHSDLNERYNTNVFKIRSSIEIRNNDFMGPYIGYQFILAMSRLFGVLDYINSLIAVLGVLTVYLLCREIYNDTVGLISIVLFGMFPTYVYFANTYYTNVPAFTFAMLSLYCFYKGVTKQNMIFLSLSGFFLSFATFIRITEMMFILPILVIYLLIKRNRNLEKNFFFPSTLLLVGPLVIWYTINMIKHDHTALSSTLMQSSDLNIIYFLLNQFVDNIAFYPITFNNFIFGYSPLLFSLALFNLVYLFKNEKILTKRIFLYSSSALFLIYFLFYGYMSGTWGYMSETWEFTAPVEASMARYFLPIYAVFCIHAAILLHNLSSTKSKQKLMMVITLTTILILSFNILSINVLSVTGERLNHHGKLNENVQNLPINSVIFTKYYDKITSLNRDTAVYRTYEDVELDPDLKYFYDPVEIEDDIIPLIDELLSSGISVYIVYDADDLLGLLKLNKEYKLEPLHGKMMWKVKKI